MKKKMKTFKVLIATISLSGLFFLGCDKEKEKVSLDASKLSSICDSKSAISKIASTGAVSVSASSDANSPYTVSLLASRSNNDGTYTWIWAVSNPNPGNGKNSTVQDLSHWGISLGPCATLADVASAATSTDGINWSDFEPTYQEDKSQDCYVSPVLKFNVGTVGNAKTYYRLIVNKHFTIEKRDALYKSGNTTGCGVFEICAIGCPK